MYTFTVSTQGHYDFINITALVEEAVKKNSPKEGAVLVFVKGATAALTIMEDEAGIKEDIKEVLEKIAPEEGEYKHHLKWGDKNGAAHIKAALIGPHLVAPLKEGKLEIGTWQEIFLIDFDEKPREREIVVSFL